MSNHFKGERRIRKNREEQYKRLSRKTSPLMKKDWTGIYGWIEFLVLQSITEGKPYLSKEELAWKASLAARSTQ